jgi:hypothetical protein
VAPEVPPAHEERDGAEDRGREQPALQHRE